MNELIKKELKSLEAEKQIKILFACESGSRAWGFPSTDSDYDVRFIYVHKLDWYLSINSCIKKDQIEKPITGDLDVAGWELRKSLNLLVKSNAALLEWLDSPIVYHELESFQTMKNLREEAFNPIACMGHYYGMAKKGLELIKPGKQIKIKKLFYCLRATLALEWIASDHGPAPMLFDTMAERLFDNDLIKEVVKKLKEDKANATEATQVETPNEVADFIRNMLKKNEKLKAPRLREPFDTNKLNQYLCESIIRE